MKLKQLAKRSLCFLLSAGMVWNTGGVGMIASLAAADNIYHEITVDGNIVDPVNVFRGFSAITCNNSSRLMMDYKEEHPDQYWAIMELLFNPQKGAGLNHIKVEMGGDINSSSGTEPATMRSPDEEPNVLRGAGWHFAADAKQINPDITVEILRWGEPKWTKEGIGYKSFSNPKYEARYQWYKQTMDAVYDEYGYRIDYVSPGQNERRAAKDDNVGFIKYFFSRLHEDAEKEEARYDYKEIKNVAEDTHSGSKDITGKMLNDSELMDMIDVIADHYTLYGNDNLSKVNQEYGKEVWYNEAVAPQIDAKSRVAIDPARGGVGGTGSIADIATRFINMYQYSGAGSNPARMTRFAFQPALAAFYEGSAYCPKQLLGAFDPWSGYYEADGGLQMVGHFMEFVEQGWNYLPGACYGDGNYTDGGVVVDTGTNNYMTVKDPETDDYSMIFANNTSQTRKYKVTVKNLEKASGGLNIWETRGPEEEQAYDSNWMQHVDTITPSRIESGVFTFHLTVKPYSIVTATSLLDKGVEYEPGQNDSGMERDILELPYTDDFEYDGYPADEKGRTYLERRGGTPRYTTDQYGAFEAEKDKTGNHVLTQVINDDIRPYDWAMWSGDATGEDKQSVTEPRTVLGDHRWTNYIAGIDFKLDLNSPEFKDNYAGIGVRQVVHNDSKANDTATYTFRVFKDGSYELYCRRDNHKKTGIIDGFDAAKWHNMQVKADENVITAYVDGQQIDEFTDNNKTSMSGRITIVSGFYNTQYDNLEVLPIEGKAAAALQKLDDSSTLLTWNGNWKHQLNEAYGHYNRTRTSGGATESGVYSYDYGQIRYFKGGNPLAWSSGYGNTWGSADEQAHYEFDFYGSGIEIYGEANSNNGTGDVYIDGTNIGTVNYNKGTGGTGHDVFALDLDASQRHTLKVVATNKNISLQKLKVIDEPEDPDKSNDSSCAFTFSGTGFNIFGASDSAKIRVKVDGNVIEEAFHTPKTDNRQTTYSLQNLPYGEHTAEIVVVDGTYLIDGIDLLGTAGEGLTLDGERLQKYVDFTKTIVNDNGIYTEEDWNQLQEKIQEADGILSGNNESAYLPTYLELRSFLDSIAPDLSERQIAGGLTVVTTPYELPQLPENVEIMRADGTTEEVSVIWDAKEQMFADAWKQVKVTGTAKEGMVKVTAAVEVVPKDLVYFLDSGYSQDKGSAEYDLISAASSLKNEKPDQEYTEETGWGHEPAKTKGYTEDTSKTQTGLYAESGKEIVYKLPLEAGIYDFTGAFREWWSMNRYMKVSVVYPQEDGSSLTAELGEVSVSGASKDAIHTGTVTIPADGVVEYRVSLASGDQYPVISWLSVNVHQNSEAGEIPGLPAVAAEDELPDTVEFEGEQVGVTWKLADGQWDRTGSVVELQGRLDSNGKKFAWKPVVYSPDQIYLIDCGTDLQNADSLVYNAVSEKVNGLLNGVPDQAFDENSDWGYVEDDNLRSKTPESPDYGLFATGLYGAGNHSGSSFAYKITLDKGEYDVTTGHTEWWDNNNRTTQVKASYRANDSEEKTVILGSAGWESGIKWTKGYVQGHLSIPEDGTVVTLTFTAMTNKAPAAAYISVEKGEVPPMTAIKVINPPNKTVYAIGEEFDPTGMVVEGYNKGEFVREIDAEELDITGMDTEETGKRKVVLYYEDGNGKQLKTTLQLVFYNPDDMRADSIKVVKLPNKTVYETNDNFDTDGMEVRMLLKASDSNAIPAQAVAVEDYHVSYDFSQPGKDKDVSAIYAYYGEDGEEEKELKDSLKVTVLDSEKSYYNTGLEITKTPLRTVYGVNESFDPRGMEARLVMTATGSNAIRSDVITDYEIEGDDFSEPGNKTIVISCEGVGKEGNKKRFQAKVPVKVTADIAEGKTAAVKAILNEMNEILEGEYEAYRTTEEKELTANKARNDLVSALEEVMEDDLIPVTSDLMEAVKEIEKQFSKAYPEITSRVTGDRTLCEGASVKGVLLAADTDIKNQVVGLNITRTELPEEVEKGKTAIALDMTLWAAEKTVTDLKVPAEITMKIPEELTKNHLLIYHYKEDGSKEEIRPSVTDGSMKFIAKGFSIYMFVSDADNKPDPEAGLSGIEITRKPYKLTYYKGDEFDPEGLVVTAVYSDGSKEEVSDYEISGFNSKNAGKETITVTYEGKKAAFEITVVRKSGGSDSESSGSSTASRTSNNIQGTWKQDTRGWWYAKKSGGYLKSEWGMIKDKWYYFNADGYMMTGWIQSNGKWYYLTENGMAESTWVLYKDQWYYLGKDGAMAVNTITPDGYRVEADGTWTH
ncbi:bacterial Ig-like domain-containing protein [Lachnospiraceae bacterium 54-53]